MESLANAQGSQRRAFAIRRNAGEALTRVDIQHDLLHHIFADTHRAFTNPTRTLHGAPPGTKVTFRDLYVNYLCNVPRISKTLRLKMLQMPEYATDYAKVALLCNVGRINTTMAFFPEMRTQLRTYHPIPSLQHTEESLQDAPRIKNLLKSALLDEEVGAPPMTPGDVLLLAVHGRVPSTSAPNLLFIFGNHALSISDTHFADAGTQDFRDFFLPIPFSSASRARAFLWLCYHYLEPPESQNPFASHLQDPDKIPWLHRLTLAEMEAENVDTDAERMCIERMAQQRRTFRAQGMNREAGGNLDPSGRVKRKRKPKIETTTERAHADDDGGIVMVNTAAEGLSRNCIQSFND
ncbi:hypothetical protein PLICRDRAFT_100789 [Plicaturopsis crispa FD-325 SS-3]|nr:hypothetical protein PLICRDRAFT_100789 [Plicaturopsis crispa FD-325 SS-3]